MLITQKKVADKCGEKLYSKSEFAELRGFQTQWETARDSMNYDPRASWLKHQEQMGEKLLAGTLSDEDFFSREDFESDHVQRVEVAKAMMRKICQQSIPLASKIMERFVKAANEYASEYEASEAATHLEFGVTYKPSGLVMALKEVGTTARNRIPVGNQYANSSPEHMLPFINFK